MGGMCNTFGAWVVLYGCVFCKSQAYCTVISGDSRHHHGRKRQLEKIKKQKKVHSFLKFLHMLSVHCIRTECGNTRDTYKHTQTGHSFLPRDPTSLFGAVWLVPGQTLGTGGILGKNTQLELSDYAVGRERGQTSQRKKLVPGFQKIKMCQCGQWESTPMTVVTRHASPTSNPAPRPIRRQRGGTAQPRPQNSGRDGRWPLWNHYLK